MEKLYSKSFQKIHTIVLYAFVFSLPLFQKLSTILLVILTILSIFNFKKVTAVDLRPYLIPAILYVLMGVSLFYSDTIELKYLENRASFVALPLLFIGLRISKERFEKILKYFVFGCLLAIISCYSNAFYNSLYWVNGVLVFQPVVGGDFSFFGSVVRDGNYFFSGFFSIFHDTIYFAVYLNTAIAGILSFQLYKKNKWYIFILVLSVLSIFQLSSKMGIITCFLIFTIYMFLNTKQTFKRILVPVVMVVIGGLFFSQNPRGKAMVDKFNIEGLRIDPTERFGYTLRLMSWDTSVDIIKKNPFFGVGVADAQIKLNEHYLEKGYSTPLEQQLNAHNTFLQTAVECGILGVFFLLLMMHSLIDRLKVRKDNNQRFTLLFILILLIAFLFESFFNRYSGIVFFMFFYSLQINYMQYVRKG